jgi:hypothetical protein
VVAFVSRWGSSIILAAWAWIILVLAITFRRAWELPRRLPDVNAVATEHLFLFPISLLLFFTLSWIRKQHDEADGRGNTLPRWSATIAIWLLAFLHPVSCGLYPAVFNLDNSTLEQITRSVGGMHIGMSRSEVEREIIVLNAKLPIPMGADQAEHETQARAVERYLSTNDADERARLWAQMSRAILIFVPWGPGGTPPDPASASQFFQRRTRASSDMGQDRIKIRYGPGDKVEEIIYSSNRQLTEARGPCTIHVIVPSPAEASFPIPCPK